MNQTLCDRHIRATCRELIASRPRVSGRELRRVLKQKYQSVGNTERIFKIWREELSAQAEKGRAIPIPVDQQALLARLATAEAAAERNRLRAEHAELREEAHQDHWAMEIDRLRQIVKAQPKYTTEIRALQEQVLRLTVELHAARRLLAVHGAGITPGDRHTP
jgi:hypothetical protein